MFHFIAQRCRPTQTIDLPCLNTENGQRKPNKAENGISWYCHRCLESLQSIQSTEPWSQQVKSMEGYSDTIPFNRQDIAQNGNFFLILPWVVMGARCSTNYPDVGWVRWEVRTPLRPNYLSNNSLSCIDLIIYLMRTWKKFTILRTLTK